MTDKAAAPPNVQGGAGLFGLRKLVTSLAGGKLCYGEPVRNGDRVVIPVARVSAGGGGGYGTGRDSAKSSEGSGGGGGGGFEAAPVGFIEIGAEGARFEAIPDPMSTARALRTVATGITALATGIAGIAAMRRRGATPRRPGLPSSLRRSLPR
jgi:uncharacterized spore protein YtfJ